MIKKQHYISPTITNLEKKLRKGITSALDEFWNKIEREGAPIIEPFSDDSNYKLVTFVVKGTPETKNAVIITALANQDDVLTNNICERIKNTNLFYKTFKVLNRTRSIYTISKNNNLRYNRFFDNIMLNWHTCSPDPFNSKVFYQRYSREGQRIEIEYSVLEMPDTKPRIWTLKDENVASGAVEQVDFYSKVLKMKRKIWIYTPPYFTKTNKKYHFCVIFDGKAFLEFTQPQITFDNLIAKKKIPPLVAVFIHNYSGFQRGRDLDCYPPFAEFIAKELVSWVRDNYNISYDPNDSVLMGSSSGALAAAFIGYKYPDIFRKILSQSGFYGWHPGNLFFQRMLYYFGKDYEHWWTKEDEQEPYWLIRQFYKSKKLPLKFYLNVGTLETRTMPSVFQFHKMLEEKGYEHYYEEYAGGHEYIAWREHLADGLIYLIGS
ncbi:MAG: alpha/beta hydrolase [Promethearchaeota archaeon]|jgi:enterochelin esterase family protein